MNKSLEVAPSASIGKPVVIEPGVRIDRGVRVGNFVYLGAGTILQAYANIEPHSCLKSNVTVGRGVTIGERVLILDGAQVCVGKVRAHSSDARKIGRDSTIGPEVVLHDEVELNSGAIVPSQRTIVSLGNFGAKNRVVTIYGSEEGPLYSIGCQIGVHYGQIKEHVIANTHTTAESASTYAPYLGVFNEIGRVVQDAFDQELSHVYEMKDMRVSLGLPKS